MEKDYVHLKTWCFLRKNTYQKTGQKKSVFSKIIPEKYKYSYSGQVTSKKIFYGIKIRKPGVTDFVHLHKTAKRDHTSFYLLF